MKKIITTIAAVIIVALMGIFFPEEAPETPEVLTPISGNGLTVHFIDVGQADCALLECDGKYMIIDGGNVEDGQLVVSYLKRLGVETIDRVVCSHAHEDHVGGLAGALNYATVDKALCSVSSFDSETFDNFVVYLSKQGKEITIPKAGDVFALGSAQVQVIGPVQESEEPNNMSLVLRVVYGNTSFLFTGDAEREEEQDILAAGYEMDSTVLKVGHHGSENSTTYPFLREIMPEYAVISVGEGNVYGHPTEAALSRLRDVGANILRTDTCGNIVCTSDGEAVSFTTQSGSVEENLFREETGAEYVLNNSTRKFHYPTCKSVKTIKQENLGTFFGMRDALVEQGYSPCGNCKP